MFKSMRDVLLIVLILALSVQPVQSQNEPGIHAMEWQQYRHLPTNPELIGPPGIPVQPLHSGLAKAKGLKATVFGYLPYWSSSAYLRFDLLTHIAVFSVEVNADGTLGNDHGWPWTALINKAHSQGVKIILVATLFDGAKIKTLITNPTYKQRFFNNIKAKMLEGKADGLNIDFEGSNSTGWRQYINGFMAELTEFLHREIPGSEVSFAGPAVNWGGSWDLVGLANSCDYIFIMGYSFYGSWSSTSGPNAPLTGGSINITNTVLNQYGYITQTQPEKLILGVPYYGLHWVTFTDEPYSNVINWVGSKQFQSAQAGALTYGTLWDGESQTPWYRWDDGSNWNQVWFDNDSSLGLKYELALIKNLKGVGMWALGYDGSRQELWNALDKYFGSGLDPVPDEPLSLQVQPAGMGKIRVMAEPSARATGYFVYLSRDGLTFADSVFSGQPEALLSDLEPNGLYFIRMRAVNSTGRSHPTEVLAATASASAPVLIVNGFDRTSGTVNPRNYIRQHAKAVAQAGLPVASCSNEAVFRGRISLQDFQIVDWMLGDESTADDTFNPIEQDSVRAFLRSGGRLFVSGAEIGWDLVAKGNSQDRAFYNDFLKATYLDDAPLGRKATYYSAKPISGTLFDGLPSFSFDNGSHGTFDVDWPDAIRGWNGGRNCLAYVGVDVNSGGAAGVAYEGLFPGGSRPGKLVYLAIPFETIYPESRRNDIMARILNFFEAGVTGIADRDVTPKSFQLLQNYPNPFNISTRIRFIIPERGRISLVIYNANGQQIKHLERSFLVAGRHDMAWDGTDSAGQVVPSGIYFYRIHFTGNQGTTAVRSGRMTLLK